MSPSRVRYRKERLYDTSRWRRLRLYQLRLRPLCELCLPRRKTVPAEVVHHLVRHQGDRTKFFTTPLQSVCKSCHDGIIQKQEKAGFHDEIGLDGWPTDPAHPANKKRTYS